MPSQKRKKEKEKFNQPKEKMEFNKGAIIKKPGSTKQYKTGEWRIFRPEIDQEKCIKCGKCWASCPDAAIYKDKQGRFRINYDYCKGCLICEKECPVKAISHKKEEK